MTRPGASRLTRLRALPGPDAAALEAVALHLDDLAADDGSPGVPVLALAAGVLARAAATMPAPAPQAPALPVTCLSCAWSGEHHHGPPQGATCPRCGTGPIVRGATP